MKKIVLLLIALLYAAPSFAAEKARPNIIFILADDMGWGDLHCYGHPYAKTPHLDKLAAEGTRFQQFYATGVTCCPSRTGFMTSWLPARYPVYPANGGFAERSTITALLKNKATPPDTSANGTSGQRINRSPAPMASLLSIQAEERRIRRIQQVAMRPSTTRPSSSLSSTKTARFT